VVKIAVIAFLLAGIDPLGGLLGKAPVGEARAQQTSAQQPPQAAGQKVKPEEKKADAKPETKSEAKPAESPAAQPPADWNTLMQKQEELSRREQSLTILEKELNARLDQIAKLDQQIKTMLEEAKAVKDEKFRHLVDVYANMKAKNAADALDKLDERTAVKILAGMRGRQAGEILNFVPPAKAAKLSEALTKMQMPFEN